jgi:hypothetical protein
MLAAIAVVVYGVRRVLGNNIYLQVPLIRDALTRRYSRAVAKSCIGS